MFEESRFLGRLCTVTSALVLKLIACLFYDKNPNKLMSNRYCNHRRFLVYYSQQHYVLVQTSLSEVLALPYRAAESA
jgi:hypothetical protein